MCPDCNHSKLLESLNAKLEDLDTIIKKTEADRRRKERLAFVNVNLSNVLPSTPPKKPVSKKPAISSESSSSSESDSDSEEEPMMLRRARQVCCCLKAIRREVPTEMKVNEGYNNT